MIVVEIVIVLAMSVFWGIVVDNIITNKGYEENWFWWGFFFGIFALIIALSKPKNEVHYIEGMNYSGVPGERIFSDSETRRREKAKEEHLLRNGGWKCSKCGKILPAYTGTCGCGNEKATNQPQKKENSTNVQKQTQKPDLLDELKKIKQLFDEGIITEDEFAAKKKQLLGL